MTTQSPMEPLDPTNQQHSCCLTVSAPGKVLLAGGYLVLESPNVGLVIAVNKRFYCTLSALAPNENQTGNEFFTTIVVKSPQFHSSWEYQVHVRYPIGDVESTGTLSMTASSLNKSKNDFVEKTLRVTLAYIVAIKKRLPPSITLTIQADNDFYSVVPHLHGKDRLPSTVESLPRFLPCPRDAENNAIVNKTGLGSSAALVTSVVGAFCQYFSIPSVHDDEGGCQRQEIVHNLAQICHCHAQGKVGSGFDVSAAVYGSHVYTKFSTEDSMLDNILQTMQNDSENWTSSPETVESLRIIVETVWNGGVVERIELPQGIDLMLADICGGSESPSMARQVLAWKAAREASRMEQEQPYWEELAELNSHIVELVKQNDLTGLSQAFRQVRLSLKCMGEAAGVPIEPDPQTELANATSNVEGVLSCVVPGAGGYDALACLYSGGEETKNRIGMIWAQWNKNGLVVCPLAAQAGTSGLRVEDGFH